MYRFRLMLIVAITWLIIAFNLERPDRIFFVDGIDIDSPVYVIAAVTIGVSLIFPRLNRLPIYAMMAVLVLIYGVTEIIAGELVLDSFAITEVSLLFVTLWVVRQVSNTLTELGVALEKAVLQTDILQIMPQTEGERAIKAELTRARRYTRPTALIYIQLSSLKAQENLPGVSPEVILEKRYLRTQIAAVIETLYRNDLLTWYDNNILILLPEKAYPTVFGDIRQLHELFQYTFEVDIKIGVAVFPKDALVFEALLDHAQKNIWRPSQEIKMVSADDIRFAGTAF